MISTRIFIPHLSIMQVQSYCVDYSKYGISDLSLRFGTLQFDVHSSVLSATSSLVHKLLSRWRQTTIKILDPNTYNLYSENVPKALKTLNPESKLDRSALCLYFRLVYREGLGLRSLNDTDCVRTWSRLLEIDHGMGSNVACLEVADRISEQPLRLDFTIAREVSNLIKRLLSKKKYTAIEHLWNACPEKPIVLSRLFGSKHQEVDWEEVIKASPYTPVHELLQSSLFQGYWLD